MTDVSKPGTPETGAVVITSLAPSARTASAIERLLALATRDVPDVSPKLDGWLDRQVGKLANGEALPAASWRLAQEPAPADLGAAGFGDAGHGWLAADPRAVCALPQLAAALPSCRILVYVESPLAVLTGWVADTRATSSEVERRLDGWRRGASMVLDLLPTLGRRLVLISIDDAGEVAGAEQAARCLGLTSKPPATAPQERPASADPLLAAVLTGWLARDSAEVLYGRLLAACEPPSPSAGLQAEDAAIDRFASIASLRDIGAARAELSRQAASPTPSDATGSGRRGPTLVEAAQALAETTKLRQDNELLNSFLQQMQEELERSSQAAPLPAASAESTAPKNAVTVAFGHEQLDAPHRHVDFSIRYERHERGALDLAGRLVEHHGRPGLLLFSDAGSQALGRWTESGDEGGRGFMLVIPGVASGAALIDALPATDLQLWLGIAGDLRAALREDVPMLQSAYWYAVASGVHDQLAAAAARLHWDEAAITIDDEGQGRRSVRLSIPRISLGERVEGPVLLCWRAPSDVATVELLRRPQAGRPWPASWPVEPHGAVAPKWALPAGPGLDTAGKRAAWKRVSPGDREWLVALLDALPSITTQGRAADGEAIELTPGEAAALARLAQDAREHIAPPRKSWARRLLSGLRPQRKRVS